MSTTVRIYPTTTAHQYWRDGTLTSSSPYTRAYAGLTSHTYYWPLPFNLSAYANKIMKSLKLKVLVDDASNTFTSGEYLAVGITTSNNSASDAAGATQLDSILPAISGDTWNEWNISGAWDTLKAGTGYIVMSGNEYGVLYSNYGTVSTSDRPYIELVYDDGTVGYGTGGAYQRCQIYYGTGGSWVLCKPYYGYGGLWKEIST